MTCPACGSDHVAHIYSAECVLREMPHTGDGAPAREVVRVLHPTGPVRLLCQACGEGWWEAPTPAGARR
jgi:hypothetical protein